MRVNLMTSTSVAAGLVELQRTLQFLLGDAISRRRTPDGFSRELHQQRATQLQQALVEQWLLQQFLPTEAANDPQPALPGAA